MRKTMHATTEGQPKVFAFFWKTRPCHSLESRERRDIEEPGCLVANGDMLCSMNDLC